MLHLALSVLNHRLTHLLQLFAVRGGGYSNERGVRVETCCLNSLVILDDEANDVELRTLAEQVVGIDIVEGRDDDPPCLHRLSFIAVPDEVLDIHRVAQIAHQGLVLVVLYQVGELAQLKLVDDLSLVIGEQVQPISHVQECLLPGASLHSSQKC